MKKSYDTVDEPIIGERYHVSWANPDCCWTLREIDGNTCVLAAKTRKKPIVVKASELQHTKQSAANVNRKEIER